MATFNLLIVENGCYQVHILWKKQQQWIRNFPCYTAGLVIIVKYFQSNGPSLTLSDQSFFLPCGVDVYFLLFGLQPRSNGKKKKKKKKKNSQLFEWTQSAWTGRNKIDALR